MSDSSSHDPSARAAPFSGASSVREVITDLPARLGVVPGEAALLLAHLGPYIRDVLADMAGLSGGGEDDRDHGVCHTVRTLKCAPRECRRKDEDQ